MSTFSQSIPAAIVTLSLAAPVFAHDDSVHVFEALSPRDPTVQTANPVDCQKDPCIDHFGKDEPHWHSSRREEDEEETMKKGAL